MKPIIIVLTTLLLISCSSEQLNSGASTPVLPKTTKVTKISKLPPVRENIETKPKIIVGPKAYYDFCKRFEKECK